MLHINKKTRHAVYAFGFMVFSAVSAKAQLNVGSTLQPGSTLQVKGSFAPPYMSVTAAAYTLGGDYFVSYNGSSAGVMSLPTALNGTANFKGRIYEIKNNTSNQSVTVNASSGETINGVSSITVPAGSAVQVVNTGLISGVTWEVTSFVNATTAPQLPGSSVVYTVAATGPVDVVTGTDGEYTNNNVDLGLSKTIIIPSTRNALVTVTYSVPLGTAGGVLASNNPGAYLGIRFLRNNIEAPMGSRKFVLPQRSGGIVFNMSSVTGQYTEVITASGSPTSITYDARGYIEQFENNSEYGYRFNMYATPGNPNFNWGVATLNVVVSYF